MGASLNSSSGISPRETREIIMGPDYFPKDKIVAECHCRNYNIVLETHNLRFVCRLISRREFVVCDFVVLNKYRVIANY